MKKQCIFPLLAILVLAGCNGDKKKAEATAQSETVPTVRLETVHSETVNQGAGGRAGNPKQNRRNASHGNGRTVHGNRRT